MLLIIAHWQEGTKRKSIDLFHASYEAWDQVIDTVAEMEGLKVWAKARRAGVLAGSQSDLEEAADAYRQLLDDTAIPVTFREKAGRVKLQQRLKEAEAKITLRINANKEFQDTINGSKTHRGLEHILQNIHYQGKWTPQQCKDVLHLFNKHYAALSDLPDNGSAIREWDVMLDQLLIGLKACIDKNLTAYFT